MGEGGDGVAGRRRATLNMVSPLAAIVGREPVTVPLATSVREVLETMHRRHLSRIVVADEASGVPLGIFTLQDLLSRVALPQADLGEPIATVMTSGLITLKASASAHQAALAMARHGVGHVVVVDDEGRLVGAVSQGDLFALQRVGVTEVSGDIATARDVEGLRRAARGIRRLIDNLMAQGGSTETLMQAISTLNDLLTNRIIELTMDEVELPTVRFCWIALGSEGRLEQTFCTDQDNGIVFEAGEADAPAVREALLPFARRVNDTLAACGFPLCKGGIMAGNPRWCLTVDEWRRTFSRWIYEPTAQALLNAAIFFDLRPVYGHDALAERLRDWLLPVASDQPIFLRLLAENALESAPPLGRIRDFVYDGSKEYPHTLDLKKLGSRPFVDAARVLALAHQVPDTSTAERLRAMADVFDFGPDGLSGIIDAFYFIHLLRLRAQARPGASDEAKNRLDPRSLNDVDRHMLKQAFRQASKLQLRLALEYRLAV